MCMNMKNITDKSVINSGHFWQCLPMLYNIITSFNWSLGSESATHILCSVHAITTTYATETPRHRLGINVWYGLQCPYKYQVLYSCGNLMAYLQEEKLDYFPTIIPQCCKGAQQNHKRGSLQAEKNNLLGDKLLGFIRRVESNSSTREKQADFIGFLKAYRHIPSSWEIGPLLGRTGSSGCVSW